MNFVKTVKSLSLTLLVLLSMSSAGSAVARADIFGSLSPEDQAVINRGEQVLKTEEVNGSPWPRITVLQRIEAPADEVAAVMFDYPLHTSMFEGIVKSVPKAPGAAVTEIDYEMTFPKVMGISLPNEVYTVLDKVASPTPGAYEISWTMVRASSMKDTAGSVKFEKLGTGMIISYTNFISPPRPALAKLIVKMAVQRVQDSVKALDKQVQAERSGDRAKLDAQVAALHKALGR